MGEIFFAIIAIGVTGLTIAVRGILFAMGSSTMWLAMILYLISENKDFSISNPWTVALFFAGFCMVVGCLMLFWSREIPNSPVIGPQGGGWLWGKKKSIQQPTDEQLLSGRHKLSPSDMDGEQYQTHIRGRLRRVKKRMLDE